MQCARILRLRAEPRRRLHDETPVDLLPAGQYNIDVAFWDIVNANSAPEDAELADTIDKLKNPDALTLAQLISVAQGDFSEWLMARKNRRAIPHRLERCGYVSVRTPFTKEGLWRVKGERQIIYVNVKASLSPAEAVEAARKLAD
jgi:hypothetical protein